MKESSETLPRDSAQQARGAKAEELHRAGCHALKQLKLTAAERCFRQALEIEPQSANFHHDLGAALFYLQRYDEAIEHLERAIVIQPNFPLAHCSLGQVWSDRGHFAKALQCFQIASEQGSPPAKDYGRQTEQMRSEFQCLVESVQTVRGGSRAQNINSNGLLAKREFFPHLLNALQLEGTAVEIGVQEGKFSQLLLRNWSGRSLISIDPWREFPRTQYVDIANVPQSQHDSFYMATLRALRPFGSRSTVWRLTSAQAGDLVDDSSLDFCYLDGDHGYEGVLADLNLWYPKIAPGGILAGHDFVPDGEYEFGRFGVRRAVIEFVESRGLTLFVTGEPTAFFPSWFVVCAR